MEPGPTGSSVVYLYGVVPRGQALPDRVGATTGDVTLATVVALADLLPAEEFSGAALEARLLDVEWVATQARRHTSMLAGAMEHGPVVPARLCTLFSSVAALRASLEQKEEQLQETLDRLRGRREWGLKLFSDEDRVRAKCLSQDPDLAEPAPSAGAAVTGLAWMQKKRRDALLVERVAERGEQMANAILDEMEATAAEVRVRPTLTEGASGVAEPMVLNAALLVDTGAEPAMHAAVEGLALELEENGFHLVLSGPWPPFSFCDADDAEEEDSTAGLVQNGAT
jgi:hypothetical protein